MKCVAASVSGRGGDPRVVRSCQVIKSGFVGVERSALSVVSLEVEVIVRWAVDDNDKSRSEAPEVVGVMQALCASSAFIRFPTYSHHQGKAGSHNTTIGLLHPSSYARNLFDLPDDGLSCSLVATTLTKRVETKYEPHSQVS
ncbi:hypothetical protein F2Q69_00017393 [Brassica cretica]|uniref:Uncharacterized protein n=1 Tax=Brassica cretica TaxID=69181 RepID=A0A8S9QXX0_BRACR|nr:hypothetical protein F2Q69_00017393 [Brassica cretica]